MSSNNKNSSDNPDNSDKYIKCTNCHQNILSSKMFLHEGFCLRNNTYCFECGKVILKKDFETHLNDHTNLKKENKSNKGIQKIENNNQQENKSPFLINQINYNSCVNMSFQNPQQKEIIKYNEPIIITTSGDNELSSPEEYKEFFLKNYKIAKLLNTNQIDFTNNQYNSNTYVKKFYPNEIIQNSNANNFRNSVEIGGKIIKEPIFIKENENYDKQICFTDNCNENRANMRTKNTLLPTHEKINIYTKFINIPDKKYSNNELNSQHKIIYNTEKKEPKNFPKDLSKIIPDEKNYKINNFILRETIPNKNYNKNDQIIKQGKCFQKNKTEPLDRTSRKEKNLKNNNIEKNQISNVKYSEIPKQKNKYKKCQYCDYMVEDFNAHICKCKNRMMGVEKTQSNQENKKILNKQNYMYKTANNNYFYQPQTVSRIKPKYNINFQIQSSLQNDKKENFRDQQPVDRKGPMDSSREKQIIRTQLRNFRNFNNNEKEFDLFQYRKYEKTPEKMKDIPEPESKNYFIKDDQNKKYRNAKTPLTFKGKNRDPIIM